MSTKIQKLLITWPPNTVRTVAALKAEGFSPSLISKYRRSGWLSSFGDGAVIRRGDKPTIFGALYALQHDMGLDVHVGGLSALELLGRSHFLRPTEKRMWLFGSAKRLPRWFVKHEWEREVCYTSASIFSVAPPQTFTEHKTEAVSVHISSELRSVFELLTLVPDTVAVEEANEIIKGLTACKPQAVRQILKACASIKAKRLFLALAEEAGHFWMRSLDIRDINLGQGPRTIVSGGRLHPKYKITLPRVLFSVD